MSYQLAMSPYLHSVEKQQNVDECEDTKYAYTDLQEHGRSLHRGLEKGSLASGPVGSRDRCLMGSGDTYNPQKTDIGYVHNLGQRTSDVR